MGHVEEAKEIKPNRFQHSNLRFLSVIEVETLTRHFSEKTKHFSKKMCHFSEKTRHFFVEMCHFSRKTSLILQTPSVVCN